MATTSDKKPLVIVGNGEIASMAFEYFLHDSEYDPVAFAIGREFIKGEIFEGRPLVDLDAVTSIYPAKKVTAFVAIGDTQLNRVRARLYQQMKNKGYRLANYISSRAFVWHNVSFGDNCFILEDNTIQPFVRIGSNVTLWSGNHVGHRSVIGDHVFMTSHVVVSGFCSIGEFSFLGVNSAVANNVEIASDNYIGMSASVSASTEPNLIYQGNPAEPRKIPATRFCRVKGE